MCDCGDQPSAVWESRPKARKDHKCCECRGVIRAGESYWRVRGIWEGDAETLSMCGDCEDLLRWAGQQSDCFCWSFGNVHTDVLDFMGESGIAALEADAKARIKSIRDKRRQPVAA